MLEDSPSITGCANLFVRNTNWRRKTASSWTELHGDRKCTHLSSTSVFCMSHSAAHLVLQLSTQCQITLLQLLHNSQAAKSSNTQFYKQISDLLQGEVPTFSCKTVMPFLLGSFGFLMLLTKFLKAVPQPHFPHKACFLCECDFAQ